MKKIIALILALGLVTIAFSSCADKENPSVVTTTFKPTASAITDVESPSVNSTTTTDIVTTQVDNSSADGAITNPTEEAPVQDTPTTKPLSIATTTKSPITTTKTAANTTKEGAITTKTSTTTKTLVTTTTTKATTTSTTIHSTSEPTTTTTTTTTVTVPSTTTIATVTIPTTTTATTTATVPTTTTTTIGVDYTEKTFVIADIMDKIKIKGRYIPVGTGISLDAPADTLEFNADCEGTVSVNIDTTLLGSSADDRYYTVSVDGVHNPTRIKVSPKTATTITLATDLPRGKHTFEFIQEIEWGKTTTVNSITINGQLLDPPANKKLIEFIGDSITCGYGVLGNSSSGGDGGRSELESATKTYAYLTAKALDVDASMFAFSGYGLVKGYGNGAILPYIYNQASFIRGIHQWGFKPSADVVVINLGTNDLDCGATAAEFEEGAYEFIEKVQTKNPGCKIVWVYGMLNTGFGEVSKAVIKDLGGAEAGLYDCELPRGGSGANGHSNIAEQKAAADVLTKFFIDNKILN